jgi:hypothetical protein
MSSQEIQFLPEPTELEIREHEQFLGTGKRPYSTSHLLSCYELKLWAMEENNEWTIESYKKFTTSKFVLLRNLILNQIKESENGRFKVTTNFENPCTKCGGAGERWKFQRKTQTLTCMKCKDGKNEDGSDCLTCRGSGKVKAYAIIPSLRSTTTCSYCKGRGFFKKKQVDNPALDQKMAEKIKEKLKSSMVEKQEKQPQTNLGAEVKSTDIQNQVAVVMIDPKQDKPLGEGATQKIKQPSADDQI